MNATRGAGAAADIHKPKGERMNAVKTYGLQILLIMIAVLLASYVANNVSAVKALVGPKA